jgi:N-acetylglucosaminyldiphosphoundecaprenol N-acetyl-beta-D-mannosaminyltransferase
MVAKMIIDDKTYASYDLFGAKITPTTQADLLRLLKVHVDSSKQCVIASQNLHGMHVRLWDSALNRLHRRPQTFVHIDGMPLVMLCRMRGIEARRAHRLTLVDWIWPLLELAEQQDWRIYYLGATEDVLRNGAQRICERLPNLTLRTHHGYIFEPTGHTSLAAVQDIVDFQPHILLVGMGMGLQERWILQHLDILSPASVCTVGACMEYIAGTAATPPRWMGQAGLEWLFRFTENPGRFWYRYLVEPWFVLAYILWYCSLPEAARSASRGDHEIEELPVTRELAQVSSSRQ